MKRTRIIDAPKFVGKQVKIAGWVNIRRDHGKLIFIDLRDATGIIQTVILPNHDEAYEAAKGLRSEYIIEMEGIVKKRPGESKNEKMSTGDVEIEADVIKVISKPEVESPVDISEENLNIHLSTLLDYRSLTLRNEKIKAIFRVYGDVLKSFGDIMRDSGFQEIKTPKIVNAATEGGANFFKIKYFDRDAYLAQSPQFYKQAGV
jgi:nondiscriminating aspartyl-tRNA synthetase